MYLFFKETVVPQVKSAQPAEEVSADAKPEEKQQVPILESAGETSVPAVKSGIEEAPNVPAVELKSAPLASEAAKPAPPAVELSGSAGPHTIAEVAAEVPAFVQGAGNVHPSTLQARSEVSSPVVQAAVVAEPEKPEDKKILTDRVTRGTEGPVAEASSSESVASSDSVKAAPKIETAQPEKKLPEESKPEEEKKIETPLAKAAEEVKMNSENKEIKAEEPKDEKPIVEASIAAPEEPKAEEKKAISEPEMKEEIPKAANVKSEEPIVAKRSSSDVKIDNEETKSKIEAEKTPKVEASDKSNESSEASKQESVKNVKNVKNESSSSDEKLDAKADEKLEEKKEIKKAEEKSSEESGESNSAEIKEIKQEKKSDVKPEELPEPQEQKERK